MAHTFNTNIPDAKTGGAVCVWGQPSLHSEFHFSQVYIGKPGLKKKKSPLMPSLLVLSLNFMSLSSSKIQN